VFFLSKIRARRVVNHHRYAKRKSVKFFLDLLSPWKTQPRHLAVTSFAFHSCAACFSGIVQSATLIKVRRMPDSAALCGEASCFFCFSTILPWLVFTVRFLHSIAKHKTFCVWCLDDGDIFIISCGNCSHFVTPFSSFWKWFAQHIHQRNCCPAPLGACNAVHL